MVWVPGILVNAGSGLVKLIKAFSGIIFGTNEHQLYQDGFGDAVLKSKVGLIKTDSKSGTYNRVDGVNKMILLENNVEVSVDFFPSPGFDDTLNLGIPTLRWRTGAINLNYIGHLNIINEDGNSMSQPMNTVSFSGLSVDRTFLFLSDSIAISGWEQTIKARDLNTHTLNITTEGAQTIDGAAADTLTVDYESKTYYSDGTNLFTK